MVLGAGHHEVDLARLETFSDSAAQLRAGLAGAMHGPEPVLQGVVVLSTCNRLEIYLDAVRFHDAVDLVTDLLAEATGWPADLAESTLRVRVGSPVGAHLFGVAAGLDAMVVGEAEIAGQVSRAYREADRAGTVSPALHGLFRSAARTAKAVATNTSLGAEGRSVASVALQIAAQDAGPEGLAGRSALIVGTGALARVVATALQEQGCVELSVFSPSGRAEAFARTHRARPLDTDALVAALATVDLVVAASGTSASTGSLVNPTVVETLARRTDVLTVIDLALQRDVSDVVRDLRTVRVIDLHSVADAAGPAHGTELRAAQEIVLAAAARFDDELTERTLDPAVVALRSHVYAAVDGEVKRLRRKYSSEVADDMERAMLRVTNALLHTPTVRAKELAKDGSGEDYVKALHTLFGIELGGR